MSSLSLNLEMWYALFVKDAKGVEMDAILLAARKKRAELVQELEKVDHFLETYHTLALELKMESENKKGTQGSDVAPQTPVDGERIEPPETTEVPADVSSKRVRVSDNPSPALVVAQAVEVIRDAGRPMTRREIHAALAERNVVVNGADPIKALGTMLWRSGKEELEQIEGWGYGLKGVDYDLSGKPPLKRTITLNFRPILTR